MHLPDESVRRYAWVNGIDAWTIAVISGRIADEAIRIYGGDPSQSLGELTFADLDERRAQSGDSIEFHLQVVPHSEFVVAVENDGYSGAFPEIARRCSADGGSFFSVYWNIHAAGMVTQAIDGAIVANFESLFVMEPEQRAWERRPDWAIGPEVEPVLAWQVCMALLERQTGVTVEPEWLTEPFPAYRIPEPYALYRDVEGADRI
jgi:hypothetical protein